MDTVTRMETTHGRAGAGLQPAVVRPAPGSRPASSGRARVVLASRQGLLLEGLCRVLEDEFEIVTCTPESAEMAEAVAELLPDAVVADASVEGAGGLEALGRLRMALLAWNVVLLAHEEEPSVAAEAFRLGARAYVLKSSSVAELRAAVRSTLKGGRYLTPRIASGNIDALPPPAGAPAASPLTPREREVVKLVAEGQVMKQVAAHLGISTRTVAFHKYRAMGKLGIRSNAGLVRFALRQSMV